MSVFPSKNAQQRFSLGLSVSLRLRGTESLAFTLQDRFQSVEV